MGISLLLWRTTHELLHRDSTQDAEFLPTHSCFGADLYAMPTANLRAQERKY